MMISTNFDAAAYFASHGPYQTEQTVYGSVNLVSSRQS